MPKLIVAQYVYDGEALEGWTKRRRNAIRFSEASADFARLLKKKSRGRTARTQRFFGEAYVASQIRHREAHYASCKWLTNRRFAGIRELADPHHERLRQALQQHFGQNRIETLQRAVRALARSRRKQLHGKTPTAPDLWLVDWRGQHRFIEVKLPGDSVAPHQFAGMAAIACLLNAPEHRVTVEVIHLNDDARTFKAFCRALRAG
jgi:hypothetical protein